MANLTGYGLADALWDEADAVLGPFTASPADSCGRGLSLEVARGGTPVDLTGCAVTLLWRHREARLRGTADFTPTNPELGACRTYWPRAMAAHEGTVDAQVAIVDGDGSVMSSMPFVIDVAMALADDDTEDEEEAVTSLIAAAADARAAAAEIRAAAARGDFDGEDGAPGEDGLDGLDGYSPSVSVVQTETGATINVTDEYGTTAAEIAHGAKGDKGDPGADADFVSATATVDSSSGTPSVDVELGGSPGARTLGFSFSGLKGAPGDDATRSPGIYLIDEQFDSVGMLAEFFGTRSKYKIGNFIIDSASLLAVVTSTSSYNVDGKYQYLVKPIIDIKSRRIGLTEGLDVAAGETAAGTVEVEGVRLGVGDLVFSPDTGCLATIPEQSVFDEDYVECAPVGLCQLATRSYVDQAIAALDDLGEVEF